MSQIEQYQPQSEFSEPPRSSSGGCIVYGCLGLFAGGVLLVLCSGVIGYFAVSSQVKKYTSTTPSELPSVQYAPEQLAELESRIERFQQSLGVEAVETSEETSGEDPQGAVAEAGTDEESSEIPTGEPLPRELVLTADDINALIGKDENLRNRLFVKIDDGKVSGDISVPIESLIPGSKGRYLNASATFEVTLDGGVLIITLQEAEVKGERIPDDIMEPLRQENLAKDLYKDPKNARMIRRFESIEVDGDRIVAKLRDDES